MDKVAAVVMVVSLFFAGSVIAQDGVLDKTNSTTIVVFPFNGSYEQNSMSWVGKGISISISDQLRSDRRMVFSRGELIELLKTLNLPANTSSLSKGSMIRTAQEAGANLAVMGEVEEKGQTLRIALRVLDLEKFALSGEISATGPLALLPQMENELAWLILHNNGLDESITREAFRERTRTSGNAAYADYIEQLDYKEAQSE